MAASTIFVSRGSSPAKGVKVVLGFGSGQTAPVYTGSDGKAVVEHSSKGVATIYADGKNCGTFKAPGKGTAHL